MPPKKQEEESSAPAVVWTVLPVVFNSPLAEGALKKSVTLKKVLQRSKIIELLKEKGIETYQNEGILSRQGELFLCENLHSVSQQYLAQSRKPADPKKDQKKDTKKDTKKEEVVVEETQKPLEFDFQRAATEFLFLLNIPMDPEALKIAIQKGLKPEVVVWIEEKVKEGSEIPSYDILNNQRTIEDFMNEMNTTSPQKINREQQAEDMSKERASKKETIKSIQQIRMKKESPLQNTIIINVPFYKDLQHPENDAQQFLKALLKRLCDLSLNKELFSKWAKDQKKQPMVPPIKETIKKEVVVEEKKDDKKGGKKDPNSQPVTEIVEEVVQKRYESYPQNIKSDLALFKRISQHRKKEKSSSKYYNILDDLALAISAATEPYSKISDLKALGKSLWSKEKEKPLSKVQVVHLRSQLPDVFPSETCSELSYKITLKAEPISSEVSLSTIMKRHPNQASLEYQYKLEQFTALSNKLGDRIFFTFDQRKFVERLDSKDLNSRINYELEFDPKVYYGECIDDGYALLMLARINPPGRIMYCNSVFDWKVVPNFQFWEQCFKNKDPQTCFLDYGWRQAGNLKILGKKMMPTDNTVISESLFTCGDTENRLITLSKGKVQYGLHEIQGGDHLFWKKYTDMKTSIYTKGLAPSHPTVQVETCIQRKQFTVLFNPYPTIFWSNHQLEESRSFGPKGQITKRMKDGSIQILYPSGDVSRLAFGRWTHIYNSKESSEGLAERQLKVNYTVDTDKKISIRQDSTVVVMYPNKDKLVIFRDGTKIRKAGNNKILISNPENIVIRINLAREKDFNVIGSGSAFAYLGFSNLLERSHDGALYQLCHPSFSCHSYIEGVDRVGKLSREQVMIVAYPDKSIIKIGSGGLLTFLNQTSQTNQTNLQERWIQLFTAAEYHLQGVYDVDLINGEITTKDAESNCFQVRVDGTGKTEIAVSFNIGGTKDEENIFGNGFHVPEQNYFLPPPQNCITPRLFVVYPDGRGEEYLTEEHIEDLKSWRSITEVVNQRKIIQYSREAASSSLYFPLSFSEKINPSLFSLPNLIEQTETRPSNVKYDYNSIYFRSLQEMDWERDFSKIRGIRESIKSKRKEVKQDIESLKHRVKA